MNLTRVPFSETVCARCDQILFFNCDLQNIKMLHMCWQNSKPTGMWSDIRRERVGDYFDQIQPKFSKIVFHWALRVGKTNRQPMVVWSTSYCSHCPADQLLWPGDHSTPAATSEIDFAHRISHISRHVFLDVDKSISLLLIGVFLSLKSAILRLIHYFLSLPHCPAATRWSFNASCNFGFWAFHKRTQVAAVVFDFANVSWRCPI